MRGAGGAKGGGWPSRGAAMHQLMGCEGWPVVQQCGGVSGHAKLSLEGIL